MPTVEEFERECLQFLAARYAPKPATDADFVWGEGSDDVSTYHNIDPERDAQTIAAVRRWRRAVFDAELGWITGPARYGGRDLGLEYQVIFDRAARAFDVPGNEMVMVGLANVAPTILQYGTPQAKERCLAAIHSGDLIACQLFSEPGAGSDLAGVTTRAEPDGDGWRVSGHKVWIFGAQYADIGLALCRTGDETRHRNLSAFLVDMTAPGVTVSPLRQITGGSAFTEVVLADVHVPREDLLGEVDDGWRVAMATLSNERSGIGEIDGYGARLMGLERYRQMIRHFGRAQDPLIRQQFADLVIHMRVAKLNSARFTADRDSGGVGAAASIDKLLLVENYRRMSDLAEAVLGPLLAADTGDWGTFAWNELMLSVPGWRLGGGTDEIQRNVIAERHLGLPRG